MQVQNMNLSQGVNIYEKTERCVYIHMKKTETFSINLHKNRKPI